MIAKVTYLDIVQGKVNGPDEVNYLGVVESQGKVDALGKGGHGSLLLKQQVPPH